MAWSDGQIDVRHYFHSVDDPHTYSSAPPSGAAIIHTYVVSRGHTVPQIIAGTDPPVVRYVPQIEMHYIWTVNPDHI